MTAASRGATTPTAETRAITPPAIDAERLNQGFRSVVQSALPAVVKVSASRTVTAGPAAFPFSSNPFFFDRGDFGRFDMPRERLEEGEGSGVIVSQDGPALPRYPGLAQGDVVQEVNRAPVASAAALERAMANASGGLVLLVNREGRTRYVVLE